MLRTICHAIDGNFILRGYLSRGKIVVAYEKWRHHRTPPLRPTPPALTSRDRHSTHPHPAEERKKDTRHPTWTDVCFVVLLGRVPRREDLDPGQLWGVHPDKNHRPVSATRQRYRNDVCSGGLLIGLKGAVEGVGESKGVKRNEKKRTGRSPLAVLVPSLGERMRLVNAATCFPKRFRGKRFQGWRH